MKIACPEEIAFNLGYIDAAQVERVAHGLGKTEYARYLIALVRHARETGRKV